MDPTGPLCLYVLFQHEWTAAGSRAIFSREKTSTGQYKAVKRKPGQPCLILPYLPVCSLLLLRLVTGKRVWQRRLSRHQDLWTLKCNVNIPMLCMVSKYHCINETEWAHVLYQFCLSKACSEATIFSFVCSWNIQSMLFRSRLKFNIQRVMGRLHLHVQHPAQQSFRCSWTSY